MDLHRRTLLRTTLLTGVLGIAAAQSACTPAPTDDREATADDDQTGRTSTAPGSSILLAYFSRPGENYHYGDRIDLDVGNTEVLAGMIAERIPCDVYRIEAADAYPEDYDATVARNLREQDADTRPGIARPLPALTGYDVVLLASPIWNVRPPMIMKTFAEALDFTGRTVHPVTTHAMSGLGDAERDYTAACPGATLAEGLAVQGEEVAASGDALDRWLGRSGLTPA